MAKALNISIEEIRKLRQSGLTYCQIAAEFDCSKRTIMQRVISAGDAKNGKICDISADELRRLYVDEDLSCQTIGEMLKVNPEIVRRTLHRHQIPLRPANGKRSFDPPADELKGLYQEFTLREIARRYGVGQTVVFKRLKEHGIRVQGHEEKGHITKQREFTPEHLANLRGAAKARRGKYVGEKSPTWKGGASVKNLKLRQSGDYREWKRAALELRGGKCQSCGVEQGHVCDCCGTKVTLHVHHVESFARVPERRFDPTNSEVLCPRCHRKQHFG